MHSVVFSHAHPDDEAIATGGTMALAADAGHRVVLVLATSGEHGEPVVGVLGEGEALGTRRAAEVRDAAAILGVERVEMLGYLDSGMMGEATNDDPGCFWQADVETAAGRLAAILREVDADTLVVYDDNGGYGHPDHIQVHRVGVRAAESAGIENVFESTMNRDQIRRSIDDAIAESVQDDDLEARRAMLDEGTFGLPEAVLTHAVDVTSVIDRKRKALLAHASQIGPDSFFLAMPDEQFAATFGTEWYRAHGSPPPEGPKASDLFG